MPAAEPGPEWVLSSSAAGRPDPATHSSMVTAACSAWPKALAHAHKEFLRHGQQIDEVSLATEVWEGVLSSVARTLERSDGRRGGISDLEGYLLGTFYHRFSRFLLKERRRQETIHLVSSTDELEALATPRKNESNLDNVLQANEILRRMDAWTRQVWIAREYGYSWNQIGHSFGVPGYRVMLRFRRRMKTLRDRLSIRR